MEFPFARIQQFLETAECRMRECSVPPDRICDFWYWLGNVKYKSDGGKLTLERAAEIVKKMPELVTEWKAD